MGPPSGDAVWLQNQVAGEVRPSLLELVGEVPWSLKGRFPFGFGGDSFL